MQERKSKVESRAEAMEQKSSSEAGGGGGVLPFHLSLNWTAREKLQGSPILSRIFSGDETAPFTASESGRELRQVPFRQIIAAKLPPHMRLLFSPPLPSPPLGPLSLEVAWFRELGAPAQITMDLPYPVSHTARYFLLPNSRVGAQDRRGRSHRDRKAICARLDAHLLDQRHFISYHNPCNRLVGFGIKIRISIDLWLTRIAAEVNSMPS
ncbi:hypothetical protein QL093DRAFT_2573225 [Fusarium oxysporum]|nr:hypothetical protein QL093DRAFT_2573225 [Fusarium oxysporum]